MTNEGASFRKLADPLVRVETGVVVFGPDWPGVYIRGDDALHFKLAVGAAIGYVPRDTADQLRELRRLLESCRAVP
ncbi:MAG: hypothetical protein O7A04_06745 [Acidobacteria bacterium]|nr:hypothetical protein [Acidobacteriota bacterium]